MVSEIVWSVYLIRCADDSLYAGIATDVARRFAEHETGAPKGAKYTRGKAPLNLVYQKIIGNRSAACKEELRIKSMTRTKKLALIAEMDGV